MFPDLNAAFTILKDFGAIGGLIVVLFLFIKLAKVLKNGQTGTPVPVVVTLPSEYIELTQKQTEHLSNIFDELQSSNKVNRSTHNKVVAVHKDLKLAMTRQKNIYSRIPKKKNGE